MNKITTITAVILILGAGLFFYLGSNSEKRNLDEGTKVEDTNIVEDTENATTTATTTDEVLYMSETVIGSSVGGRDITAYHYGNGETELLFIGGIHGGYSWNTVLLARNLMDYLESDSSLVPKNLKITVIPILNPDGLEKTVGTADEFTASDVPTSLEETISGRFNANDVDLNRNFDCDWKTEGTWQKRTVSGGSVAFSEPEAKAVRDYVDGNDIGAAVVWYSSLGGVFASNCHEEIMPETLALTNLYSKASGYKAYEEFNFYAITGDMVNWFAKEGIPAVSVLLTTHEDVEWDKNKLGIDAVIKDYSKELEIDEDN